MQRRDPGIWLEKFRAGIIGKVLSELDLKDSRVLTSGVSGGKGIPSRGNSLCKGTETGKSRELIE